MKQPGQEAQVGSDLYAVLESCRWIGLLLTPLLPDLSARILGQLACPSIPSGPLWPPSTDQATAQATANDTNAAWRRGRRWGELPSPSPLPEATPVMRRLELPDPL
jgi:methionyl-tRNA synthetase